METVDTLKALTTHIHVQSQLNFLERDLGSGEEGTTMTFISDGGMLTQTITPSTSATSSSSDTGTRHGVSQTVLQWIFAVIALCFLGVIVTWRYWCVRRSRRSAVSMLPFYRPALRRPPSTHIRERTLERNATSTYTRAGMMLSNIPGIQGTHRIREHIRGLDVDGVGRRGVGNVVDELPAYESDKRPPEYVADSGSDLIRIGLPELHDQRISSQDLHAEPARNAVPDLTQNAPVYTPDLFSGEVGRTPPLQSESASAVREDQTSNTEHKLC